MAWNLVAGAAWRLSLAAPANAAALGREGLDGQTLDRYVEFAANTLARGLGLASPEEEKP